MEHTLTRGEDHQLHCTTCLWSWTGSPSSVKSACPGVPRYGGYEDAAKAGMKTFTMLRQAGLQTDRSKPAACIYIQSRKEWVWLYDEKAATPRRTATEAQKLALAKGRATAVRNITCQECGQIAEGKEEQRQIRRYHLCSFCAQDLAWRQDHNAAIRWAREKLEQDVLVLDTETTGLDHDDVVIEVALIGKDGTALLDTLVQTTRPISPEASAIHGIRASELAFAPAFAETWPKLLALMTSHPVVAYNADFDVRLLRRTAKKAGLEVPEVWGMGVSCLMEAYAAFRGNVRGDGDYQWCSLRMACEMEDIRANFHRAKGDAGATLALLKALAGKEELPEQSARQRVLSESEAEYGT